jgi:nucleotide-binding universal stress UspA family protein
MRILVCLDELPTTADTLIAAQLLAGALPADVTALAVAGSDAAADALLEQARDGLRAARSLATARAVGPSMEDAIAAVCQGQALDLVVAAPTGRHGLARILHGSRVLKLVRQATTSVWIARRSVPAIQRILVGVSGAPHSEIDVQFAARLALAFGAELTVLHVVSQVPLMFTGLAQLRYDLERFLEMDMPGARQLKRAREICTELQVPSRFEVREGLVSDELAAEAGAGYDLLIIGAHLTNGMPALLLDNITEHALREVPASTLVVRAEPVWERLDQP